MCVIFERKTCLRWLLDTFFCSPVVWWRQALDIIRVGLGYFTEPRLCVRLKEHTSLHLPASGIMVLYWFLNLFRLWRVVRQAIAVYRNELALWLKAKDSSSVGCNGGGPNAPVLVPFIIARRIIEVAPHAITLFIDTSFQYLAWACR
jgi:hypothetical protein